MTAFAATMALQAGQSVLQPMRAGEGRAITQAGRERSSTFASQERCHAGIAPAGGESANS